MKKTICVILILTVLFSLFSCTPEETEKTDIRLDMYKELFDYYNGRQLQSYLEAASLCTASFDFANCVWDGLLASPEDNAKEISEYLISYYFLDKAGCDVSGYTRDVWIEKLQTYVSQINSISTSDLAKASIALDLMNADYDRALVCNSFLERQHSVEGAFFDYPQTGTESAPTSISASAEVLTAYMSLRNYVSTTEYEDCIHDNTLVCLGNAIGNDNTVADDTLKPTSFMTARVLSALIAAEIPLDGEISTALLKAMRNFSKKSGDALAGYCRYLNSEIDDTVLPDVLFCVVCTLYGNPLVQIPEEPFN